MFLIQLVIIQVITFAVLVFVLRKLMYSSSLNETKRLQSLNEDNVRRSRELAKKIEEADTQYKEKIIKAEEEIKKANAQAKKETDKLREDVLFRARQDSQRIVEQAMSIKDKIREELEAQLQDRAIAFSLKLIKDVLSLKNMESFHGGLIDEVIGEIEKVDFVKFGIKAEKGELIAPYEIDKKSRKKIEEVLLKKTGKNILCEEKIDKEIIAGIVVKLGSFVIDGSLSGRLKDAGEALKL